MRVWFPFACGSNHTSIFCCQQCVSYTNSLRFCLACDSPGCINRVISVSVSWREIFPFNGQDATVCVPPLYYNKEGRYVVRKHTPKACEYRTFILFTGADWAVERFRQRKSNTEHWLRLSTIIKIQSCRCSAAMDQPQAPLDVFLGFV